MPDYRLNLLSRGQVFGREDFEAADDADAVQLASTLRGKAPAELWAGDRQVHVFERDCAAEMT